MFLHIRHFKCPKNWVQASSEVALAHVSRDCLCQMPSHLGKHSVCAGGRVWHKHFTAEITVFFYRTSKQHKSHNKQQCLMYITLVSWWREAQYNTRKHGKYSPYLALCWADHLKRTAHCVFSRNDLDFVLVLAGRVISRPTDSDCVSSHTYLLGNTVRNSGCLCM